MDTNSMFALMDIIVLGCGAYILYAYYLLMAKNEIKQGVLVPQKTDVKKCRDMEGYKKFIGPKLLLFGISACISGGLGLYQDYVAPVNTYLYFGLFVLFFAVMIWFLVSTKKAEKLFW